MSYSQPQPSSLMSSTKCSYKLPPINETCDVKNVISSSTPTCKSPYYFFWQSIKSQHNIFMDRIIFFYHSQTKCKKKLKDVYFHFMK